MTEDKAKQLAFSIIDNIDLPIDGTGYYELEDYLMDVLLDKPCILINSERVSEIFSKAVLKKEVIDFASINYNMDLNVEQAEELTQEIMDNSDEAYLNLNLIGELVDRYCLKLAGDNNE